MGKKSRKQKTPKAVRNAIQARQRERANKKKATANAHGEHCYVAYQHADKRSQRIIKKNKFIQVIVDEQYQIASIIEDGKKNIAELDRQIAKAVSKVLSTIP